MISLLAAFVLLCGISTEVAAGECRDAGNCSGMPVTKCHAGGWVEAWMKRFCRKTCGFCTHVGGCGKPDIKGIRVIAGKTAVRGSWPWQILLMNRGRPTCGGALIAPQWVVTAAHCVYMRERSGAFRIRVGEQDRNVFEGSEVDIDVETVFRHEDYDARYLNNDIALLKLKKPAAFTNYVSPVCLPSAKIAAGSDCYITGWGEAHHPGPMTRFLQQGILPIVSNEVCFKKNRKIIPIPITPAMICGGSGGTKLTSGCFGDSGGPLVCNVGGVWELHGSVSHGSPACKSAQAYTVFSRTHHFLDWIKAKMANN